MSETLLRIISGIAIAVIYVVFFQYGGYAYLPLYIFITLVNITVLNEFYGMYLKKAHHKFIWNSALLFSVLIVLLIYLDSLKTYHTTGQLQPEFIYSISASVPDISFISGLLCVLYLIITGIYNIIKSNINDSFIPVAIGLFGIIYIPFTISFIFKLRGLPDGAFYIWMVSVVTVMTDVWGYFVGKFFGKHKVNMTVSPKKTWEGYIGSFVMQILSLFLFYYLAKRFFTIPEFSPFEIISISILIFSSAVFGDLFESLVKRNAATKDSGNLLPGHGGLLDRIDSIMFSLPLFYFYLSFFR